MDDANRTVPFETERLLALRENFVREFGGGVLPGAVFRSHLAVLSGGGDPEYRSALHGLYSQAPLRGAIGVISDGYGESVAVLSQLRGIREPFNFARRLIGFQAGGSTPRIAGVDEAGRGTSAVARVLAYHRECLPLGQNRKLDLMEGSAERNMAELLAREATLKFALLLVEAEGPDVLRAVAAATARLASEAVVAFEHTAPAAWLRQVSRDRPDLKLHTELSHRRNLSSVSA